MMELVEVTKHYQQGRRSVQAVRGVSLRVAAGEFVSIMGPSGSGKSTLMHLMGALDTPSTGRALFQGKDLNALSDRDRSHLRRTRIGFVFQFFNLLPTLTAVENVALPLLLGGVARGRALKDAAESLERINMSGRASHLPEEMSGGEGGLARARHPDQRDERELGDLDDHRENTAIWVGEPTSGSDGPIPDVVTA